MRISEYFRWPALAVFPALLAVSFPAHAATPDGFWSTPTIQGYGRIHFVPDAAYLPEKDQTYRIVFSITQGAKTPDAVNGGLDHVARTVNLYVAAGVPLDHLKFVAEISGGATPIALSDAQYQAKFGVDNPNSTLIAELRKAGVDVAVCAQAMAEHDFAFDWRAGNVTLTLSALTTVSILEHQGYAYLQF